MFLPQGGLLKRMHFKARACPRAHPHYLSGKGEGLVGGQGRCSELFHMTKIIFVRHKSMCSRSLCLCLLKLTVSITSGIACLSHKNEKRRSPFFRAQMPPVPWLPHSDFHLFLGSVETEPLRLRWVDTVLPSERAWAVMRL